MFEFSKDSVKIWARSVPLIIHDGTIAGYRGRAIAAVHSIVLRDTVTSLPAGSVTRGVSPT